MRLVPCLPSMLSAWDGTAECRSEVVGLRPVVPAFGTTPEWSESRAGTRRGSARRLPSLADESTKQSLRPNRLGSRRGNGGPGLRSLAAGRPRRSPRWAVRAGAGGGLHLSNRRWYPTLRDSQARVVGERDFAARWRNRGSGTTAYLFKKSHPARCYSGNH